MQERCWCIKIMAGLIFLISIFFTSTVFGFSIEIINDTGVPLRIDLLEDNCGKAYIEERSPVVLDSGESMLIDNLMPVVHHYKICANGTCEATAIGMHIHTKEYVLRVTLKHHCICIMQNPLIWPGTFKCEEAQFEI